MVFSVCVCLFVRERGSVVIWASVIWHMLLLVSSSLSWSSYLSAAFWFSPAAFMSLLSTTQRFRRRGPTLDASLAPSSMPGNHVAIYWIFWVLIDLLFTHIKWWLRNSGSTLRAEELLLVNIPVYEKIPHHRILVIKSIISSYRGWALIVCIVTQGSCCVSECSRQWHTVQV